MDSVCPLPDCGFFTSDANEFNAHMRAHDAAAALRLDEIDREQAAASDVIAQAAANRKRGEEQAAKFQRALDVLAPLFSAVNLLLSSPEHKQILIANALPILEEMTEDASDARNVWADAVEGRLRALETAAGIVTPAAPEA
jgi:hypothetical protein